MKRFEKLPIDLNSAREKVKEEEENVRTKEEQLRQMMEELAGKAKIEGEQRSQLIVELRQREKEISESKAELAFLRRRLARAKNEKEFEHYSPVIMKYIRDRVLPEMGIKRGDLASRSIISSRFESVKDNLHPNFLKDLAENGLFTPDMGLNSMGIALIRRIMLTEDSE